MKQLSRQAAYWFETSMTWMDERWDHEAGLFATIDGSDHSVRNTIWYAFGLLQQGRLEPAYKSIEAVLKYQYDRPETVYHGSFKRSPKEPDPPANPLEWKDYDPNWREFIGTVFLLMIKEFELPEDLKAKLWVSLEKAAEGAYARNVNAAYTNIALMSALLLDHMGKELDKPHWRERAEQLAQAIYTLYSRNDNFWEFNSPTYYGTDLYALSLWRDYGLTDTFRHLGSQMEAGLWRDIARFYHADLKNLCGPYDRSYGMDMTEYLALLGLYIALALDPKDAPLPDTSKHFGHDADFMFTPLVCLLGTTIPEEVLPDLQNFQKTRQLERVIEPGRVATAFLSQRLMLGGESIHPERLPDGQFHPATAHWQVGSVCAWLRLRCAESVAVRVEGQSMTLTCPEKRTLRFEIEAPGLEHIEVRPGFCSLPGLEMQFLGAELLLRPSEIGQDKRLWLELDAPAGDLQLLFAEKPT